MLSIFQVSLFKFLIQVDQENYDVRRIWSQMTNDKNIDLLKDKREQGPVVSDTGNQPNVEMREQS